MEIVLAIAIGVLTGSGVWLLLRPRSYQVIMGLALLSYAVNLFIFSMGRQGLSINKVPVLQNGVPTDLSHYADPMPQALVLTAIVIGVGILALALSLAIRVQRAYGTLDMREVRLKLEQEISDEAGIDMPSSSHAPAVITADSAAAIAQQESGS
ncbi:MAG: Na+/H+ antiporter subunit C [Alcanivorax sp.]|nr:Na+/H+ antiporter subunit C [Alcanivorax sp.]